ncbi:MAG: HPr family phosphocarrier protein [Alphaproteobacteria bacterium]|nr:HPr family phosphocarrier protein [Alphaproteobacteria bacterium]
MNDAPPGGAEVRRVALICNMRGLHARAAAKFVNTAGRFDAKVTVSKGGMEVSGQSIMGLLMLGAGPGTRIELRAEGAQADAVLAELAELIAAKFHED